ncbi:C4-dicarboxylate ABC transporter substrate-binding protein, partial [Streptomyces sp. SID1328]|nr:C4-dicarboxylate ABC transporter substrate-binding protein [Streptomyces sp. SID1328]
MTGRTISRRGLLRSALLGGPALALPGCARNDGPHRRLTLATGAPGGPYHAFGHALAAEA